jgi:hypothetical protein
MLAHGKQRQRRNITIITASTANKLGSDNNNINNNNNNNNNNMVASLMNV